jgi:hypothetical protein
MLHKNRGAFLDDINEGLAPHTKYQRETSDIIINFLAFASITAITLFFIAV